MRTEYQERLKDTGTIFLPRFQFLNVSDCGSIRRMNLKRYLLPAGYWAALASSVSLLVLYVFEGGLAKGAAAVAFLALSISLKALAEVRALPTNISQK